MKRAFTVLGINVLPRLVRIAVSGFCLLDAFIFHESGGGELAFPSLGEFTCFVLGGLIAIGDIAWLAFEVVLMVFFLLPSVWGRTNPSD